MTLYEDVGKTLKKLQLMDPYYALFMMGLEKQETKRVPTMAVGLKGINTILYINPDFWFGMTKDERYGVCKHEMLHLCFMHLLQLGQYPNQKLHNIATDAEINQYIDPRYLPKDHINIEQLSEEFNITLDQKAGSDYYYKKLKDKIPEDFDLGDAEHFWEEFEKLTEAEQAVVENQITYLMEATAEEIAKGRGTVPGEISGLIAMRKKPPKFDWKKHMRQWVGNSSEVYTKPSRFKVNAFFPGTPASKIKLKQNILFAIDTSGSVSEAELEECMSELFHIWKLGHTVTILCADTQLYEPYIYQGQNDVKIHGRGGTYFSPVLEYFNSNPQYSCMIYFTDGGAELPPNANRPMLWVISSQGDDRAIKEHNGKKLIIQN